jgi:RHS repeat-associated protein
VSGIAQVSGNCDTPGDLVKTWLYTYDGDGTKVKQIYTDTSGTLTTYYYAGGSYEVQTDGTTSTVRQYYSLGGVNIGMREGTTFDYFLTDHQGSVVGVTDAVGTLISETRYMPFGQVRASVGTITQTDYGYTFQQKVNSTGLMDYDARMYDASLGRFIQADTIASGSNTSQTLNRYSYTTNNPIKYVDPSGHVACWDEHANDPECKGSFSTANGLVNAKTYSKSLVKQLLVNNDKNNSTLYWDGLDTDTQKILSEGGYNRVVYNEILTPGVEKVDPLYDPVIWFVSAITLARVISPTIFSGISSYFSINEDYGNELNVGDHALERMEERQISLEQLENALQQKPFQYFHDGVWKTGFYDPISKIFVSVYNQLIITVINKVDPNYIQNLINKNN